MLARHFPICSAPFLMGFFYCLGFFCSHLSLWDKAARQLEMIVWWSLDESLICSWSNLGGPATPGKIQHCFLFVDNGWSPKTLGMALLPFPVWQMSATLFPSSFFRGMMCYFLKTFNPLQFVWWVLLLCHFLIQQVCDVVKVNSWFNKENFFSWID